MTTTAVRIACVELIAERDHQLGAQEMHDRLARMSQITARFRAAGAHRLPQAERDGLVLPYGAILEQGFAFPRMHAPPPHAPIPNKPGRRTQEDAKNLLDALLAFLHAQPGREGSADGESPAQDFWHLSQCAIRPRLFASCAVLSPA